MQQISLQSLMFVSGGNPEPWVYNGAGGMVHVGFVVNQNQPLGQLDFQVPLNVLGTFDGRATIDRGGNVNAEVGWLLTW